MKRALGFAVVVVGFFALAANASWRSPLEIFGLGAGDTVEIDGTSIAVKTGLPKSFSGQPLPGDAPAITELELGTHEIAIHRNGCATRTFVVDVQGAYQRSIVVAPAASARCALPAMPPRVQ